MLTNHGIWPRALPSNSVDRLTRRIRHGFPIDKSIVKITRYSKTRPSDITLDIDSR